MKTKFLTKIKEVFLKAKNAVVCAMIAAPATAMIFCTNALAATPSINTAETSDNKILGYINNLSSLVLNIITAAGIIITAWGIFEFANGYQSHDGTQQSTGLKRVIAGLLMVFAGSIMSIIGISVT